MQQRAPPSVMLAAVVERIYGDRRRLGRLEPGANSMHAIFFLVIRNVLYIILYNCLYIPDADGYYGLLLMSRFAGASRTCVRLVSSDAALRKPTTKSTLVKPEQSLLHPLFHRRFWPRMDDDVLTAVRTLSQTWSILHQRCSPAGVCQHQRIPATIARPRTQHRLRALKIGFFDGTARSEICRATRWIHKACQVAAILCSDGG